MLNILPNKNRVPLPVGDPALQSRYLATFLFTTASFSTWKRPGNIPVIFRIVNFSVACKVFNVTHKRQRPPVSRSPFGTTFYYSGNMSKFYAPSPITN